MFFADQVAQLLDIPDISSYTPSYVLVTTALIAAKLYCGLGNYSQTAIFPRMPSVTEISKSVNMGSLLGAGCIVGKFIKEQKVVPIVRFELTL